MYGYEYGSGNPFTSRGNGSAYDLFNANPALFGPGSFGSQPATQNPWFTTSFGTQQQPFMQQQPGINPNPGWQQQQQFHPLHQYPQQSLQQPAFGSWPWTQQQQFGFGSSPMTQVPTGTPAVYTTKAVDVELTIPAQTVVGRNPIEVQQYVLQVVVPTLIEALTKRAIAHDVGRSVSYDVRGGCVARVGI